MVNILDFIEKDTVIFRNGGQFEFKEGPLVKKAKEMNKRDLRKKFVKSAYPTYIRNRIVNKAAEGLKLNEYKNVEAQPYDVSFKYTAPTFEQENDFSQVLSKDNDLTKFQTITELATPKREEVLSSYEATSLQELITQESLPIKITSSHRPGDKTKQGRPSHHSRKDQYGNSMAYDIVPYFNGKVDNSDEGFEKLRKSIMGNKRVVKWFTDHGFGLLDETVPAIMQRTGATGKHFHIGPDRIALQGWNNLLNQYGLA